MNLAGCQRAQAQCGWTRSSGLDDKWAVLTWKIWICMILIKYIYKFKLSGSVFFSPCSVWIKQDRKQEKIQENLSVHQDLFLLAVENKFQYFIEMKEINNTVIKIVHKYLDCTLFLLQDQKIYLNKGQ